MKTPICDYVNQYAQSQALRLHMPGHKGAGPLGVEGLDITEISGADSLYEASGIIRESEQIASEIFGCPTFYSTEGSSQCIRAMVYLAMIWAKRQGRKPVIAAGRNAHKAFLTAAALLDADVCWLKGCGQDSYLSCGLTPAELETAFAQQVTSAMMPMFLIFGLLYAGLFIPLSYALRMTQYVIIDKPGQGALFAMKESAKMMRGSRMRLFKLDLSLWWWYALSVASTALCYGDTLLPMAGISLPFSEDVAYFVFYILFLIVQFLACYFLRSRIEVVYAQVYNALKPREKETGVVLGNIFQM